MPTSSCVINLSKRTYNPEKDRLTAKKCLNKANSDECRKDPLCTDTSPMMGRCKPTQTPRYCPGPAFSIEKSGGNKCESPDIVALPTCEKYDERRCVVKMKGVKKCQDSCERACQDMGGTCGYCLMGDKTACVCRGTKTTETCAQVTNASACQEMKNCDWTTEYNEPETLYDMADDGTSIPLVCTPGSAIKSVCGSGSDRNCKDETNGTDYRTAVRCEPVPMGILTGKRYTKSSQDQFSAECDANDLLVGVCLSGAHRDCNGSRTQVVCEKTTNTVPNSAWNRDSTSERGPNSFAVTSTAVPSNIGTCQGSLFVTGVCNGAEETDCSSRGPTAQDAGYTRLKCGDAFITPTPPFTNGDPIGLYEFDEVHAAHCCLANGETKTNPFYLNSIPHAQCEAESRNASSEECQKAIRDTSICSYKGSYQSFPACREWCNSQESTNDGCDAAAHAFCQNNPLDDDCKCVKQDPPPCSTEDEVCNILKGIPKQCWWKPCSRASAAKSHTMSDEKACPVAINLCSSTKVPFTQEDCDKYNVSDKACNQAKQFPCEGGTATQTTGLTGETLPLPRPLDEHDGTNTMHPQMSTGDAFAIFALCVLVTIFVVASTRRKPFIPVQPARI